MTPHIPPLPPPKLTDTSCIASSFTQGSGTGSGTWGKARFVSVAGWGVTCQELAAQLHVCLAVPPAQQSWVVLPSQAPPVRVSPLDASVCAVCVCVCVSVCLSVSGESISLVRALYVTYARYGM